MDNNTRYYDDEREIDLIDILGRIIVKWRPICITALIGLLIGIVVSCTIGYINMKKSDMEAKKLSAQKAESIALEKLLKDEKGEVLKEAAENNLAMYVNLESLYETQDEYNKKSIYKNLDASNLAKVRLTYYVDNHYVSEYPVVETYNNIEDVLDAYRTALVSDEICEDIIKALGMDTEPQYIRELVVFPEKEDRPVSNLVFDIVTDNADMSRVIADYYKGAVDKVTANIASNYGDVTVTLQDEQLNIGFDLDIMVKQNESDQKLIDYYNQLQRIENSMSGAQGDYFKAILAKYNLETIKIEAEQHGFFSYVSKVLIVIVTVAFGFVAVAFYGVIYLFNGVIKTGDELAGLSRSTLLGTVLVDGEKKRKSVLFDKWAIALTDARVLCDDSDRMIETIVASVKQYLGNNGLNSVLCVGSDIGHSDVIDKIRTNVSEGGFTVNVAVDAFDSPDTVNYITESDVVVFIGEIGKSKYKKLERVLSLCQLYKKNVMGTVAIQERV